MDQHALEYFSAYTGDSSTGHFHRVMPIHDDPTIDWSQLKALSPGLCRGWFELAKLPSSDRIEFSHDFWLSKLPYRPNLKESLDNFFGQLDDIGIFITQQKYDDPFSSTMVYSLRDNEGFFLGNDPAGEQEILALQRDFLDTILPNDFTTFLQMHNGFAKYTDTGVTSTGEMYKRYEEFQEGFEKEYPIPLFKGEPVNPKDLIPFYKSFGMPYFQCFWKQWYPDQEMGNVYYSLKARTIPDYILTGVGSETMAFETFVDWLMFYLEKVD